MTPFPERLLWLKPVYTRNSTFHRDYAAHSLYPVPVGNTVHPPIVLGGQ